MTKQEYNFGGFTYELDENGNYNVNSPYEEPTSLFKYYPNNEYSKDAINNQYLFCSHPYHLNDSMDSSNLLWDFSNITEEIYNSFYSRYDIYEKIGFSQDEAQGFKSISQHLLDITSNNTGIISLTTEPLHTLMWAHYASEKGYMIELDYKEIKDNLTRLNPTLKNYVFFPIQYVENLEKINLFQRGFTSPDVPFLYSVGIKRKDWTYENEWRFMPFADNYGIPHSIIKPQEDTIGDIDRKLYYPKNAIKSITLGKHFFNGENVLEIIDSNTFKLKQDLEFINFIFENFNEKIYLCGEFENDKTFKRSAEKIELNKINDDTFRIIPLGEVFYQE